MCCGSAVGKSEVCLPRHNIHWAAAAAAGGGGGGHRPSGGRSALSSSK